MVRVVPKQPFLRQARGTEARQLRLAIEVREGNGEEKCSPDNTTFFRVTKPGYMCFTRQ